MRKILFTLLLFTFATASKAAIITSNTTEIVTTGQSFNTSISIPTGFSSVIIEIIAKGDFDDPRVEYFRFSLDGIQLTNWNISTPGLSVTENTATLDYTLVGSVSIAQSLWDSIVSDGILDISWVIGPFSDPSPTRGGVDFISYEIQAAPVPVSGSFSIFVMSLALILFSRTGKLTRRR